MKKQIHITDIELLSQLFVSNISSRKIIDSNNRILRNYKKNQYSSNEQGQKLIVVTEKLNLNHFSKKCDAIFDFGKNKKITNWNQKKFHYITNRDGSIRWMFQNNDLKSVLCFFARLNFKSKCIYFLLLIAAKLKLGNAISQGSITIYSKDSLKIDQSISSLTYTHYGIFTGTFGFERTPVLAIRNKNRTTEFVKIALNQLTLNRINNEKRAISRMTFKDFKTFEFPKEVFLNNSEVIVTSSIEKKEAFRSLKFGDKHVLVIQELLHKTAQFQKVEELFYWDEFLSRLHTINHIKSTSIFYRIHQLLIRLKKEVNFETNVLTCYSFGDFTPWNAYETPQSLLIYDLENAHIQSPFLFDFFHFHFQKGIIVENKNFNEIYEECKKRLNESELNKLVKLHNIDIDFYLKLYLMYLVCEQVKIMLQQDNLSLNQLNQLKVWEKGLHYVSKVKEENLRLHFMFELNDFLKKYKHAFIKFNNEKFDALPIHSDLDIAIHKKALLPIIDFVQNHHAIESIKYIKKSFMSTVICNLSDGNQICIDLIHQFKRRAFEMMPMKYLLRSSQFNDFGVSVPELRYDLEYCLCFYYLNNSVIPEKYKTYFQNFSANEKSRALNYIKYKYDCDINEFEDFFTKSEEIHTSLKRKIKTELQNNKVKTIKNVYQYITDKLNEVIKNQSITITLSGVDGVGKSTIIDEVIKRIELKMRREVVLLRHRPRVLPILSSLKYGSVKKAENKASITLPGSGKNNKKISSYLRFSYYFSDYVLGQIYIFLKYKIKGKVVVYDRYYFDFINHPERSNIRISKRITKWFYRFISKPHLNILLVSDSKLIHARKQELSVEMIEKLTSDYILLFEEFKSKYPNSHYCLIQNETIQTTADQIFDRIKNVA